MNTSSLAAPATLLGRLMLAAIFVLSGFGKIMAYGPAVAYSEKFGVPGALMPLVIAAELGGGLLIAIGWQTRLAALALAGFSVVTALFFHNKLGDQMQLIQFMKNIAMAGGFLILFVHGAGAWSVDGRGRA